VTTSDDTTRRHERVERHRRPDRATRWPTGPPPAAPSVAISYIVVWLVRISPSLRLKRWLLRRIGVTVGEGLVGPRATPDVFWPELITVEADAIVGYDATGVPAEPMGEPSSGGRD